MRLLRQTLLLVALFLMCSCLSEAALAYDGMRKVCLSDGSQALRQEMMATENTSYVIQADYDLKGATINIPDGCVLQFDGGSLRNGCLQGALQINDCRYKIFENISFTKEKSFMYADFVRPEWFGARGNYDYSRKTGFDNSRAINDAVKSALLLKVNLVKFSSGTYYVSTPIVINSGDVALEGVYGELREDLSFSSSKDDISPNKGSTLISDTDSPIIETAQGGTHPLIVRNLNFRQEYNSRTKSTQTKAVWLKGWSGPQSPFIFEYCHFFKFRHAIYVQSDELVYNVSKLTIRRCAFSANYWCVYFGNTSAKSNYAVSRNVAGEFVFEDNACHHNVRGISVGVNIAPCYVVRNVFEGNLTKFLGSENPTENYMNYIGVHNSSTLRFESNYFEQNTVKHLKLNVTALSLNYMDSYVTLKDNISVPHNSGSFYTQKVCEIEQDGGWEHKKNALCNHLHILYSDYDFEVSSGRMGLMFHDKMKNVTFTGDCYVHLYANDKPRCSSTAQKPAFTQLFFNNEAAGLVGHGRPTFADGAVHYGYNEPERISDITIRPAGKKNVYLCVGAKVNCQADFKAHKFDARLVIGFEARSASQSTSAIFNTNDFDYMFAVRRQSVSNSNTYSYQVWPSDVLVSQIGAAYMSDGNLSFQDINWNFSPENIVLQENVDNISGQKEGDTFFNHTASQHRLWSNNRWK